MLYDTGSDFLSVFFGSLLLLSPSCQKGVSAQEANRLNTLRLVDDEPRWMLVTKVREISGSLVFSPCQPSTLKPGDSPTNI